MFSLGRLIGDTNKIATLIDVRYLCKYFTYRNESVGNFVRTALVDRKKIWIPTKRVHLNTQQNSYSIILFALFVEENAGANSLAWITKHITNTVRMKLAENRDNTIGAREKRIQFSAEHEWVTCFQLAIILDKVRGKKDDDRLNLSLNKKMTF